MNQKGISSIVIILILVGVLAVAGGIYYFIVQKPSQPEQPVLPTQPEEKPVTCPQDAKLCPDGSYVSRTGPNCEFAACPTASVSETPSENISVKVYFFNSRIKPINLCNEVVAVTRVIPKTEKIATAAINELLKGPNSEEQLAGYTSNIPVGSKLNSLTIVNGKARADFNATTESGGGSCSMEARTTQIEETLLQFPTIKTVKLSIDGRTEYIFQP